MCRANPIAVVLVAVVAVGCQSNANPAGPRPVGPTSPVIASLTISGADAVLTGSSTHYTATATMSDGTTRALTPTWSSTDPNVASLDITGQLDGRAHGRTTLTATANGISTTKIVQVVNDYGGTWAGRYVINSCQAPPTLCDAMEWDVFSFPIQLGISHSDSDPSAITATLVQPNFQVQATIGGRVTSDGRLNLAGRSNLTSRGRIWATIDVASWDTNLSGGNKMTGRWTQRLSNLQPAYNMDQANELETLTKTGPTGASVSALPGARLAGRED